MTMRRKWLTENYFYHHRARRLAMHLAHRIPKDATVLDIGSGDGYIAHLLKTQRPDIAIQGADVLLRPKCHIPMTMLDGSKIPYTDNYFDAITLVDVLHHTLKPQDLLIEAARVSRNVVIIKDHIRTGMTASLLLRYLDWVGNLPHGVPCPANYWTEQQWRDCFHDLAMVLLEWTPKIQVFPPWLSWLFDRSMNVMCVVKPAKASQTQKQKHLTCHEES